MISGVLGNVECRIQGKRFKVYASWLHVKGQGVGSLGFRV
jgi:hypothetical protein